MELEIGSIYEGKVTGITKFGAFVLLPMGKSGMVHISEVANTFVDDINNFLKEGQTVTVKLIAIDPQGRINLSIKKTQTPPPRQPRARENAAPARPAAPRPAAAPAEPQSFDDMLKAFMADSDSKISSIKQYSDHRTKSRRR